MIADDLTGAADCAAACAGQGMRATVLLHASERPHADEGWPLSEILSIDANTRALPAARSAAATADLMRLCARQGALGAGSFLFKKLDSTLRGNWAVELAAMLHAYGSLAPKSERPGVILAPALPAQGRTTIDGRQRVHGRPLEETEFWQREGHDAGIAAMLAEVGLAGCVVALATVRSGGLRETMARLTREADVLICDAETDDDLRRIAEASAGLEQPMVWAGSGGLAWHLPQGLGIVSAAVEAVHAQFAAGPTLFVVGTLAAATCRQAAVLAREPDVVTVRIRSSELLKAPADAAAIVAGLRAGRDVLVWIDETERCAAEEATLLTRALARAIAPCAGLVGGLVATGGETARALFDELGIRRLRLLGEVEPGLPFSIAEGWSRPVPVLTKAGGFGTETTLVHYRAFLRRLERGSADARHASVC